MHEPTVLGALLSNNINYAYPKVVSGTSRFMVFLYKVTSFTDIEYAYNYFKKETKKMSELHL